jgi:hypothetical protein
MADATASVLSLHARSMPLLVHLEELRKRIILSVLGVLGGFILVSRRLFMSPAWVRTRHRG